MSSIEQNLWTYPDTDLNAVMHPAAAFDHLRNVVADSSLTREEKRAIHVLMGSSRCLRGRVGSSTAEAAGRGATNQLRRSR